MMSILTAPFVDLITQRLACDPAQVARLIGPPSRPDAGDLALPCFALAKATGRKAPELAAELATLITSAIPAATTVAAGAFLNITLPPAWVSGRLLPAFDTDPDAAFQVSPAGKAVCIDFSSPNIAKHLAFHHIRSTMIGNALARCYAAAGWTVTRINFLGDWGTGFGRVIAGWKREGRSLADLEAAPDPVTFLNELYVRISRAAEADPDVAEEARSWSRRLETGDTEALGLWQVFKDASLAEFRKAYRLLGVEFDDWNGEAHYRDSSRTIVAELEARGLLAEDQGARVVDLGAFGLKKPCLILRSDGGSLYAARDLAACDDRYRKYRFDRCLYEVDLGQALHFKEWFSVARLLGRPYVDNLRHVGHGLVLMWNEEQQAWAKTATRKGVPMMLMDVLQEAIERARAIVAEKNPDLPPEERERVAQAVGVGAVVFNDLKANRKGDVRFRFDDALNMQGDTGPYLQYTHARLCSIERKAATAATPAWDRLEREDEKRVLLALARLASSLAGTVENDDPSILAGTLLDLAGKVSTWLTAGNKDRTARVLCDDPATAAVRLRLTRAARLSLGRGLALLGLQAPERM